VIIIVYVGITPVGRVLFSGMLGVGIVLVAMAVLVELPCLSVYAPRIKKLAVHITRKEATIPKRSAFFPSSN